MNESATFPRAGSGWRCVGGCGGFTLIELIGGIGVTLLLLGCFYSVVFGLYRLQDRYVTETQAVVVMGNAVERLEAKQPVDAESAGRVFQHEFARSDLSRKPELKALCVPVSGGVRRAIVRTNGVVLAELKVGR